jgi:hypothetical protein
MIISQVISCIWSNISTRLQRGNITWHKSHKMNILVPVWFATKWRIWVNLHFCWALTA